MAPTVAQRTSKLFDYGGLARAACRQIPHDHDQTAQRLIVQETLLV